MSEKDKLKMTTKRILGEKDKLKKKKEKSIMPLMIGAGLLAMFGIPFIP